MHRDKPSVMEGFPMRRWNIQVFLLNEHGEEIPASIFDKTTYKLHPSFEKRATQCMTPLQGWSDKDRF